MDDNLMHDFLKGFLVGSLLMFVMVILAFECTYDHTKKNCLYSQNCKNDGEMRYNPDCNVQCIKCENEKYVEMECEEFFQESNYDLVRLEGTSCYNEGTKLKIGLVCIECIDNVWMEVDCEEFENEDN